MIHVIGIGPGQTDYLVNHAIDLLAHLPHVYGSQRQLDSLKVYIKGKPHTLGKLGELLSQLKAHLAKEEDVAVLASGDPMLYGIGNYLYRNLPQQAIRIHPGISSLQYIFSRTGMAMNDVYLTSSHGREPNIEWISQFPKVAMVTDDKWGPYQIAQALLKGSEGEELAGCQMVIGENLSYDNERIEKRPLSQVEDRDYAMNVVVILNER
ncbi:MULTISPECIES: precorrin-6y C5,15-methyltransferase (decarboxylating) subunit CbiE [Aerococcus]|uniref:Precorrin-6y C5,15-methyltransferase (Decarboxylating) subunit CbiE n=1 Tax=Aerococcus tenax TaxID=3078812 RepID=A0A5N1BST9_9LACT|nr:precorrin-6y C5,15-methyltransferase (decarboxylating) subunit CbiE [Aerococcus urinae]KAA9241571.1 precorrin-6y C5,15-methyltransferase (decarboxylating) subunit CbiE [Aerococcus urinae]MDK6370654.1 precorrin-6y C5,15-methyltransferase (decarboxylating) subunit CbiE [Aerococcus urinae]MDK6596674.1 precorrin-6y C5,15-methyltransferase (decarboxylating) subunit CbiE [Aerococcus urinae]MDK7302138.1 precorrin-6y C5,15-methyltransferase (decarboxylating) subunit CbiE [Aerococcus urinae]MDK78009